MILQELVKCYEGLKKQGLVPERYFSLVDVTFKMDISLDGKINYIKPLKDYDQKRKRYVPITIVAPEKVNRSRDIKSNFVYENSSYLLGFDNKDNPKLTKEVFNEAKKFHNEILKENQSEAATAVKNYFNTWDPEQSRNYIPDEYIEDLFSSRIVISYKDELLTENKELLDIWKNHCENNQPKKTGQCLVTGEVTNLVLKHPKIMKLKGGQTSGTSLVSFNDTAYESYGLKGNDNAPVGSYAAFAYTTALNYMLSNYDYKMTIGDTTIVFWADTSENKYSKMFKEVLGQEYYDDNDEQQKYLKKTLEAITMKKPLDYNNEVLNGKIKFNILGLNPNVARVVVKFFYRDSYNKIFDNINAYYKDFNIAKPEYEKFKFIPLWMLIQEIIGQNKQILLTEKIITSILNDTLYPTSMLQNTIVRIKAENDKPASPIYASIIKGYLSRYYKKINNKEELTMALNPECKDIPYVLGRLFSVYEQIQYFSANGNLNAPIKNRYFNLCMTNPAIGYPIIGKLSINHLRKLNTYQAIKMEKKLRSLLDLLQKEDGKTIFPKMLNLQQQGEYYLGYYHQTQERYENKEEKENE